MKYFLNEYDFLTGNNIPRSEVLRTAHIRAEYDDLDRLVNKLNVDRFGQILSQEQYSYVDTNTTIRKKELIGSDGKTLFKTVFGKETQSLSYIEWVFGVDSVKKWNDRFTTSELNEIDKPKNYRFFDVDAYEYGGKEFDYDSSGRLTRDEWFRRPDGKSMHKFLYKYYDDTDITHMFEYDSNGVLIMDVKLSPDGTEAVFWFTGPPDSSFRNISQISYNLDGDLNSGHVSWIGPRTKDSNGVELKNLLRGDYNISLLSDSVLRDSVVYNIEFKGEGTKGYLATKRIIKNITFDISPPLIELEMDKYIRDVSLSFKHSEPIVSAYIVWSPDINFADIASDTVFLTKEEINFDKRFRPTNQVSLIDGVMYDPKIYAVDRAGNLSDPPGIIEDIIFDTTPPALTINSPINNAWVNNQFINMKTNEPIQEWTINVAWQGGKPDSNAPYEFTFLDTILDSSLVDLASNFQLNDGSTYQFSILGKDLAGNISQATIIDSIHYDITPPVLTMIYPFKGSAINDASVSYITSEILSSGEFLWTFLNGTPDSLSPHRVELIGEELNSKEKIRIKLKNEPLLTDGASYTITLIGKDLAGNESEPIAITDILYDTTPPEFTNTSPSNGEARNHQSISYSLSETINTGYISWTQTAGVIDENSPHIVSLNKDEMTGGPHEDFTLEAMPNLKDGGIYKVEFIGTDRAGNHADTVRAYDVLYDFTSPEIVIEFPLPRSISNTTNMSYNLSEDLFQGEFKWVWLGGVEDTLAPYIAELNLEEMTAGPHNNITLSETPLVVENALYTLSFSGRDRAGNYTQRAFVPGLQYDFTPPTLTWLSPRPGDAINHKRISFENSETLEKGTISWIWVGGKVDTDSIQTVELTGDELNSGPFLDQILTNPPQLVDGAVYNIAYSGFDPAGNESNLIQIETVLFDITQPEITILYPLQKSFSNKSSVSYTLSEEIFTGTFKWRWLGGEPDTSAPYSADLTTEEMTVGDHMDVELSNNPSVVEKALYTLTFVGQDRAGNRTKPAFVSGLQYDFTPPELGIIYPVDGEAINEIEVHYKNSESLQSAQMIWKRIGGTSDASSPHIVELVDDELKGGEIGPIITKQSPNLIDGAEYLITYIGIDPAGNKSDSIKISNVQYDITAPQITIDYPKSEIFTTETQIKFIGNEDLYDFNIDWLGTYNGRPDVNITYQHDGILSAGNQNSDELFLPDLIDGYSYTITLNGRDRAGNKAISAIIRDIKIDLTPPEFTNFTPISGSFINNLEFGWTLSEDIAVGELSFSSSNEDITVILGEKEKKMGTKNPSLLINELKLVDGEQYNISIFGKDFANNESNPLSINQISYDISPPILSTTLPISNSFVNTVDVVYQTNEDLIKGNMTWLGENESPMIFDLLENNLKLGRHKLVDYKVIPKEGILYSILIQGIDRAGNEGISDTIISVMFDITPPELTITSPLANSSVNHTKLSFNINETISNGTISWKAVKGNDPRSPHVRDLMNTQLVGGQFDNIEMSNPPELSDGVVYDIYIAGRDLAGNDSKPFIVNNITYDVTPPQFVDISPADSAFIREANLSYRLTEDLESGKIIFNHIGGALDPAGSHVISLAGSKKQQGARGGKLPPSVVKLVNGASYDITFEGLDAAGNNAPSTIIKSIVFDNEAPIIKIDSLLNGSFFKNGILSYNLSEKLKSGLLQVERINGENDLGSTYKLDLGLELRNEGINEISSIPWIDGESYNLLLSGIDRAENPAELIQIKDITYDVTLPVITIDNINNNSYINNNKLSYTLSEEIRDGRLIFTADELGGDPKSPQEISLKESESKTGTYVETSLMNGPSLVNGVKYSILFSGKDRAGNEALPVRISNVTFDNQKPKISISKPLDAEQIKRTTVSYFSDEDLSSGFIVFTQTSGTVDVNSPHRIPLDGKNLTAGVHNDIDLGITSELADGGKYEVSIEAFDKAGNKGQVTPIGDVFFDILPPILTLTYPQSDSYFNKIDLSYGASEELGEGKLVFSRTGGANDPNSPHTIELTENRLKYGDRILESFENDLNLKDGAIYTISFSGQDVAGNIAIPVTVENITYDISEPEILVNMPTENGFYNKVAAGFSLNEPLISGQIVFKREGGTNDPLSPHSFNLDIDKLKTGIHSDIPIIGLTSNAVYSVWISGTDQAGNQGKSLEINRVTFDNISPDISITSPLPNAFINTKAVGLSTNETLTKAKVSWVWIEGKVDQVGTHESSLVGDNLQSGVYENVNFSPSPSLVSDAKYKLIFEGTDLAGNSSLYEMGTVYYDDQPPTVKGIFPISDGFTNILDVSYELNEPLKSGTLTWVPVDGSSFSPIEMVDEELSSGIFLNAKLQNQNDIIDVTKYNIEVFAIDKSGNESNTTIIKNITYDKTKPKFTSVFPSTGSRVNSQLINWTVDEPLSSGRYTWIHMGGAPDPAAPHSFDLTSDLLQSGAFDNTTLGDLNLVADAMYRITLEGTDLAGNTGKKFMMSIVYDNKPPKLEIKYPVSNSSVNKLDIAYYLDEKLSAGQFIYTSVGDQQDPNSPVKIELIETELETIFEAPNIPKQPPILNDGATYNIQFIGSDLANNKSESNIVENVKYDVSRPKITIYNPSRNSIYRGEALDIEVSEDLKNGNIIWTRTGGLNDLVNTHKFSLIDQYLSKGRYDKINLSMETSLSSGVIYSVGVEAVDFAGNLAEPVLIESIEYVRDISGKWFYKGQIIEVVWVFEPDDTGLSGNFMQGLSLGTKISDQEKGRFTIDFSRKPWSITFDMDNPDKNRISLFEFKDDTHIKVVTGTKRPSGMDDGEIMEYEWRPE